MEYREVPHLHPTEEEFEDFESYIALIEKNKSITNCGICVIHPPASWKPRTDPYEEANTLIIQKPIRQLASGGKGAYQFIHREVKTMPLSEYEEIAKQRDEEAPDTDDIEEIEACFWKSITYNPPIYGADTPGSLYQDCAGSWNLANLDTLLTRSVRKSIPGVNTPFIYAGMWRASFVWHTEDKDLYSINYLHLGKAKVWFTVPPSHADAFERLAHSTFSDLSLGCREFLRHKTSLIHPKILMRNKIPVFRLVHNPGQFVINFPRAYHCGFNTGFNVAESVNFAMPSWVPIGKRAGVCNCDPDAVRIDMKRFDQKQKYDNNKENVGCLWLQCDSCDKWRRIGYQFQRQQQQMKREQEKQQSGGAPVVVLTAETEQFFCTMAGRCCSDPEDQWDEALEWVCDGEDQQSKKKGNKGGRKIQVDYDSYDEADIDQAEKDEWLLQLPHYDGLAPFVAALPKIPRRPGTAIAIVAAAANVRIITADSKGIFSGAVDLATLVEGKIAGELERQWTVRENRIREEQAAEKAWQEELMKSCAKKLELVQKNSANEVVSTANNDEPKRVRESEVPETPEKKAKTDCSAGAEPPSIVAEETTV